MGTRYVQPDPGSDPRCACEATQLVQDRSQDWTRNGPEMTILTPFLVQKPLCRGDLRRYRSLRSDLRVHGRGLALCALCVFWLVVLNHGLGPLSGPPIGLVYEVSIIPT